VSFEIDLLVRNASILTMDDDGPLPAPSPCTTAGVLALYGGREPDENADESADGLRGRAEIDAQGALLVPGFGTHTTTWPGSGWVWTPSTCPG